jgi:pSer/pThr/pTyr-binding forkhead associated (FHA) protein
VNAGALKFRQTNLPRQTGELARLKIIQGPDYGSVFVITSNRVTLGRGDDNDIILADLKASRQHAELAYTVEGWVISDKGSANGILYSGKFVRSVNLRSGEVVSIGETTIEFVAASSGTMVLMAPPKAASAVKTEQAAFLAKKAEVRAMGKIGGGAVAKAPSKPGGARGLVMILLAVGVFAFLFMGDEKKPTGPKKDTKNTDPTRNVASKAPPKSENIQINKTAEMFFRAGFREYNAGNYFRARTQFETVLQIVPGHPLAQLYLNNCNNAIDTLVKGNLQRAKKNHEAGKLKEARGEYQEVMRLLDRNQTADEYKEAKDGLDGVEKEMKDVENSITGGDS